MKTVKDALQSWLAWLITAILSAPILLVSLVILTLIAKTYYYVIMWTWKLF